MQKAIPVVSWIILFCGLTAGCSTRSARHNDLSEVIEAVDVEELLALDTQLIEKTARYYPNTAFYAAYLSEKRLLSMDVDREKSETISEMIFRLYKAALADEVVRDGAAEKLLPLTLASRKNALELRDIKPETEALRTLKAAAYFTVEYYTGAAMLYENPLFIEYDEPRSSWDEAILLIVRLEQTGKGGGDGLRQAALDYFLTGTVDEARRWCHQQMVRRGLLPFGDAENNAVRGRLHIAAYGYRAALDFFRLSYPKNPALYQRYASLQKDLGTAYLYGGFQEEGAKLFLGWETAAAAEEPSNPAGAQVYAASMTDETGLDMRAMREFRYRCLYYAARLRRASGKRALAGEHFRAAIGLAPDSEQRDACIWYLIEMAFAEKTEKGVDLMWEWAEEWHDGDYFSDHYDKITQWAVSKKNWKALLSFFPLVERGSSGITRVKFAYIIGRALEDGHIAESDLPKGSRRTPRDFFYLAYSDNTAPFYRDEATLYYRVMAAERLGLPPVFILTKDNLYKEETGTRTLTTQKGLFLNGFFTHGAARYAPAWIRESIQTLPLDELRILIKTLEDNGGWGEAIRLTVALIKRPDFTLTSEDLGLLFPLGFKELIERFSDEYGFDKGVLFSLVRTESIFIPDIVSHAGAVGLSQLMPQTALDTAKTIAKEGGPDYVSDGTVDRTNPEANLHIGSHFLSHLFKTQSSPLGAILSYNGGPTRVRRWARASNLSPDLFMESIELKETREYGKKVLGGAALYDYFHFSLKSAPILADIVDNYSAK